MRGLKSGQKKWGGEKTEKKNHLKLKRIDCMTRTMLKEKWLRAMQQNPKKGTVVKTRAPRERKAET